MICLTTYSDPDLLELSPTPDEIRAMVATEDITQRMADRYMADRRVVRMPWLVKHRVTRTDALRMLRQGRITEYTCDRFLSFLENAKRYAGAV